MPRRWGRSTAGSPEAAAARIPCTSSSITWAGRRASARPGGRTRTPAGTVWWRWRSWSFWCRWVSVSTSWPRRDAGGREALFRAWTLWDSFGRALRRSTGVALRRRVAGRGRPRLPTRLERRLPLGRRRPPDGPRAEILGRPVAHLVRPGRHAAALPSGAQRVLGAAPPVGRQPGGLPRGEHRAPRRGGPAGGAHPAPARRAFRMARGRDLRPASCARRVGRLDLRAEEHAVRGALLRRGAGLDAIPFFLLGAAAGLFTAWVERRLVGAEGAPFELTVVERALIAGRAIWFSHLARAGRRGEGPDPAGARAETGLPRSAQQPRPGARRRGPR